MANNLSIESGVFTTTGHSFFQGARQKKAVGRYGDFLTPQGGGRGKSTSHANFPENIFSGPISSSEPQARELEMLARQREMALATAALREASGRRTAERIVERYGQEAQNIASKVGDTSFNILSAPKHQSANVITEAEAELLSETFNVMQTAAERIIKRMDRTHHALRETIGEIRSLRLFIEKS